MAAGANRRDLRAIAKAVMDATPRLASVAHRGILAPRPDVSRLPERMVATPLDRVTRGAMGLDVDREVQLVIMLRRKGETAQDELDLDQDAIEAALIAAIAEQAGRECDLRQVQIEFDGDGAIALAQMTLTFAVTLYD
jgi:hypothetical protein